MKIEKRRLKASQLLHVQQISQSDNLLRSRIKACVSNDRMETVTQMSRLAPPPASGDDLLTDNLLLVKIVKEDECVLRRSLKVCERIALELGIPSSKVSFPGLN